MVRGVRATKGQRAIALEACRLYPVHQQHQGRPVVVGTARGIQPGITVTREAIADLTGVARCRQALGRTHPLVGPQQARERAASQRKIGADQLVDGLL
ncbi:hypothetical protein D3C79_943270 [compost metagenome]